MGVFVERVLTWNGAKLSLRFAAPDPPLEGQRPNWRCRYEIRAEADPARTVQGEGVGADGLRALELAIDAARIDVEKRFPGAYIHEPSHGPYFSYRVGQSLPYSYFLRLRKHLEHEAERKERELIDEIVRLRRAQRTREQDDGPAPERE